MKLVESIEEYKVLIKKAKKKDANIYNNIYLMPKEIKRYIEKELFYVEENAAGCIFYVDQITYFRVYLCVDLNEDFSITPKDKKCVIRDVYSEKTAKKGGEQLDKALESMGFVREETIVQIQTNTEEMVSRCAGLERFVKKLEKQGFICKYAEPSRFGEIDQMMLDSTIIKDYHIEYLTQEEKEELEEGSYLCVVNDANEICAASLVTIENGIGQGTAIVIKDEYKLKGLAPILTYYRGKWLQKLGVENTKAWIVTTNETSIKYHTSIGCKLLEKYVDEWILDTIK